MYSWQPLMLMHMDGRIDIGTIELLCAAMLKDASALTW
jgi:hypothetical protein